MTMRRSIPSMLAATLLLAACGGGGSAAGERSGDSASARSLDTTIARTATAGASAADTGRVELTAEQMQRAGIRTATAGRRRLQPTVHATGRVALDGQRVRELVARVDGWIQELHAVSQERLAAGDTMALLYSPSFMAAQTELLQAARNVERARASGDSARLATARSLVSAARQKLRILGADSTQVRRVLRTGSPEPLLPVRAPVSGTVLRSEAVQGGAVSEGDLLFRMADLSRVWGVVDVYASDLRHVERGDRVALTTRAFPADTFGGRIRRLSGEVDRESRTVTATASVPNPGRKLRAGMKLEATVRSSERSPPVLAVPEDAIQQIAGRSTLFVRTGEGRFAPRTIETGTRSGRWVEVLSGLEQGEEVAVAGTYFLKSALLEESFAEEE